MTDYLEIVEAFADNEPVAAAELSAALADASAREHLIEVLVLRGWVSPPSRRPAVGVLASRKYVAGGLQPAGSIGPSPRDARTGSHRGFWLTAAAALVAVGTMTGYFAGRIITNRATDAQVATDVVSSAPAPAPTHVIRLENGVEWNERSGGK